MMKTATFQITVRFDDKITDPDSLCLPLDTLMEQAQSTIGILNTYGNPTISSFELVESLTD